MYRLTTCDSISTYEAGWHELEQRTLRSLKASQSDGSAARDVLLLNLGNDPIGHCAVGLRCQLLLDDGRSGCLSICYL